MVKTSVKKARKSASPRKGGKQASLFDGVREDGPQDAKESISRYEMSLSPITDRKSYDAFVRTISMRIYFEFDKTLRSEGIEKPEISLVGFDLKKPATDFDAKMVDYVALNARLIVERAFVDVCDYAARHMPRIMREMSVPGNTDRLSEFVESKIQRDIMMEIRAIAMQHIPEDERFRYINKLKEL